MTGFDGNDRRWDSSRWMDGVRRRPVLTALALATALSIQLVPQSTFHGDDYLQLGVLEGTTRGIDARPLDLYRFMDGSPESVLRNMRTGPLPWFAHPRFKVAFFRPISSASVALDHAFFGLRPWAYRIQAILWYLLVVALYAAWLRRVMPAARGAGDAAGRTWESFHPAAVLALVVFVVSDSHWVNVGWTAGRWVLVTTALALAGCVAHRRWRRDGWRPGLVLAPLFFALGLLAGELALAVLAYPIAFEIVAPVASVRERARGLAPLALVGGVYLVVYRLLGRGASGGTEYLDPTADPLGYLIELPGKLLAMLAEVFLWVPAGWWNVDALRDHAMAAGAGALVLMTVLLAPVVRGAAGRRVLVARLAVGTVGSMLPLAAGAPGGRNLIVPFVGAALLVGIALHFWWSELRSRGRVLRVLATVTCLGLGFLHLVLAPYRWVSGPIELRRNAERLAELVRSTPFVDEGVPDPRTVFLTVHFAACWNGFFLRRLERLPMPERWWMLSAADAEHHYHRPASDRLVLESVGGEMMATRFERLVRGGDEPISAGTEVDLDGMRVRVLEVGRHGPTRVAFAFDRPLDDPSVVLMAVLDGRLRRVEPPPIGGTLRLPSPW